MNRNLILLFGALLVLLSTAAFSAETSVENTALIMGAGANTCAQFAQQYGENTAAEVKYFSWVQGFMSGMNSLLNSAKAPTRDLRAHTVKNEMEQVREYCDAHPLQVFEAAALDLYNSLPKITKRN